MDAKRLVITRLLPKTGQIIYYKAGDDGDYEAGWWRGRLNADNKTRFISKTIGGDDVVIDRATGLMWAADGTAAGCKNGSITTWEAALSYANGLDFAGFTDWRIPNIRELGSIVDYSELPPTIDGTFFPNTDYTTYWSSTTFRSVTYNAWGLSFLDGSIAVSAKFSSFHLRCVRGGL